MSEPTRAVAPADQPIARPSRFVARAGLAAVALIIVVCFAILLTTSHA